MRFVVFDNDQSINLSVSQVSRFDFIGLAQQDGKINMLKNRASERNSFSDLKELLDFIYAYYQSAEIARKYDQLQALMNQCEKDLTELRAECPHVNHSKTPHSNSGNYDPSADAYWYACECFDCGKRWHEDQ